ncbi:PRA1 family protein H [Capsicum annuum]|nr:PRA1 family protein H [Capsicum annuum]
MAFLANPLSLSVPESAFESWLRDTGYLEILDQRTTDLHRQSTTPTTTPTTTTTTTAITNSATAAATAVSISNGVFVLIFLHIGTLLSLIKLNPFAKLNSDDFSCDTPSWTVKFVGSLDCYSFPLSSSQAKLRVHENVKRYARNYASLFVLFFACSLYALSLYHLYIEIHSEVTGSSLGNSLWQKCKVSLCTIHPCGGALLRTPRIAVALVHRTALFSLTLATALEMGEKLTTKGAWESRGDVDSMGETTANCIRETVREVLGVSRG